LEEYAPIRIEPWGIRRCSPVAVSNTFSLTWALIGPGSSEFISVMSTEGINVPVFSS